RKEDYGSERQAREDYAQRFPVSDEPLLERLSYSQAGASGVSRRRTCAYRGVKSNDLPHVKANENSSCENVGRTSGKSCRNSCSSERRTVSQNRRVVPESVRWQLAKDKTAD